MVQKFQTLFENFDLVNMSKLVISKPNISKTDISYLKLFENLNQRRNIGKKWVKTINSITKNIVNSLTSLWKIRRSSWPSKIQYFSLHCKPDFVNDFC